MKAVTENKILPTKYYWFGIFFLSFLAFMAYIYMEPVHAALFLPYILLIYFIGRHKQENRNPEKIG
jgi:hypothetical protein